MRLRTFRRTIARNRMKEAGIRNPGAAMGMTWKKYDPARKSKANSGQGIRRKLKDVEF